VLGVSEDGHARHPVADTAGELVVDETVAAAAASAEPAMPEATRGAAPRVLLVDDDGTVRTIARALLERAGYTVAEADNGEDGLRMLREDVYGLLVLDLSMPRMDGRAVLRAVRGDINTAGLPVIVLTGSDGEQAEVELMDMGADDYIRKPIDPPRFVTRVRATLRRALG
jgi:two-component system response regulator ResD